jgi:uncharacterized protein DUF5677
VVKVPHITERTVAEETTPDETERFENAREAFKKEKKRFVEAVKYAIAVSKTAGGRAPDQNIVLASYVFTRMCIAADTLLHLLQRDIGNSKEQTLDHYTIGVLARNIIESALMFHYLSEDDVSKEEWELRTLIFNLHDSTLKVRFWKGLGSDEQYKGWKGTRDEVLESMKEHPTFKALDEDRQKLLLTGQQLYIKGFRSTLKLVDLDETYFDGMYAYLSSQVHISPSSLYWTERRVSFGKPGGYQYYFASYAVAHARQFFLRSAVRLAESDINVLQKSNPQRFNH